MEKFAILAVAFSAFLAGCESAGFSRTPVRDIVTPQADATTTVRTWDNGTPSEKEVPNSPAFEQ